MSSVSPCGKNYLAAALTRWVKKHRELSCAFFPSASGAGRSTLRNLSRNILNVNVAAFLVLPVASIRCFATGNLDADALPTFYPTYPSSWMRQLDGVSPIPQRSYTRMHRLWGVTEIIFSENTVFCQRFACQDVSLRRTRFSWLWTNQLQFFLLMSKMSRDLKKRYS